MCDYCDCRSQPEIAALSADHERLGSITSAIRRAVKDGIPAELGDLLDELIAILAPHARREELGVFAALRRTGVDDAYLGWFEQDHERLEHLLAVLDRTAAPATALELADLLDDHILREESDLFPAARGLLPPSEWDAVEAAIHAAIS